MNPDPNINPNINPNPNPNPNYDRKATLNQMQGALQEQMDVLRKKGEVTLTLTLNPNPEP